MGILQKGSRSVLSDITSECNVHGSEKYPVRDDLGTAGHFIEDTRLLFSTPCFNATALHRYYTPLTQLTIKHPFVPPLPCSQM